MDTQLIEETILARASDLFTLNCLEGGIDFPADVIASLAPGFFRTAIQAAREHYAAHPEHLEADMARCLVCNEQISGVDLVSLAGSSYDDLPLLPARISVPCGHPQP